MISSASESATAAQEGEHAKATNQGCCVWLGDRGHGDIVGSGKVSDEVVPRVVVVVI